MLSPALLVTVLASFSVSSAVPTRRADMPSGMASPPQIINDEAVAQGYSKIALSKRGSAELQDETGSVNWARSHVRPFTADSSRVLLLICVHTT